MRNQGEGPLRPSGVRVAYRLLKEQTELGDHCRRAYRIIAKENIVSGVRVGTLINGLICFALLFIDVRHRSLLLAAHTAMELPLLWLLFRREVSFMTARVSIVVIATSITAVYAYILRTNMETHAEARYVIASTGLYLALAGCLPFFIPIMGFGSSVLAAAIGAASYAYLHQALPVPVYHFTLMSFLAIASASRLIYDSQIVYQAVLEYDFSESMIRAERAKTERDLDLAREVQAALLPANGTSSGPVSVHFQQMLHQTVGGDWLGVRQTPSGMAVVVADASGKGVQAALIVQALQTLWAEQPDGAAFDPEEWIAKVNRMLLTLSRHKPQTMTLGLLEVNGRELTYWSAGHPPAFVKVKARGEDHEILVFTARGDMLGIKPRIELNPTSCEIPAGVEATVIFGSDGVFDTPARYGPRHLEELFVAAETRGEAFIASLAVPDDRTLVRVEVAA